MEAAASPSSAANSAAESGSADSAASARTSRVEIVRKRLVNRGIPASYAERGPEGLIEYVKEDRSRVHEAVTALFPDQDEIPEPTPPADDTQASACRTAFLGMCVEAAYWIQWLIFERDPKVAFADTTVVNSAARGICGAVWGGNDIAYRCKTCEHDPTCAICVPCFKAGDHRGHDYSMIHTVGGCCDCGDVTAWKQSGFCINHKGPGHVPSLPPGFVASAAPVLEAVLKFWVLTLEKAILKAEGKPKKWNSMSAEEKIASQTTLAIIKMLLESCCAGESMLSFTAKAVGRKDIGVLDALLRSETFMPKHVVESLHELLYKLLGDSNFKHAFALVFISHYSRFIRESVADELVNPSGTTFGNKHRDHSVLSNFSVQIFTVPTLTPKLVLEHKLLDMLMGTLKDFLIVCGGEDGRLMVSKGPIIAKLYIRVTEDIRYVMTHFEVAQYVIRERKDLSKAWVELLAYVQGMHPQKRVTSIHVEEENDDWDAGYHLEAQMASIHPLFVNGAAAATGFHSVEGDSLSGSNNADTDSLKDDDDYNMFVRHAKVGRISPKEVTEVDIGDTSVGDIEMADVASSSCVVADEYQYTESILGVRSKDTRGTAQTIVAFPAHPLIWLISECANILEKWLALDFTRELAKGLGKGVAGNGSGPVRQHTGTLWRGRARGLTRGTARTAAAASEPTTPTATPPAVVEGEGGPGRGLREWLRRSRRPYAAIDDDRASTRAASLTGAESADMDVDVASVSDSSRPRENTGAEWWMCTDDGSFLSRLGQCTATEWPQLDFDVSRQEVSFHIPLHRIMALLLRKVLELHSSNIGTPSPADTPQPDTPQPPWKSVKTLQQLFPLKYQVPGFAASLMEHPLRLQVLCAQVQAGMWRRNGHTITTICDLYRTVPWCEDTSELDMLVLQCCAVIAPPEKFVQQIQSRFGLADYFTLFLWRPNEYESSLAQEFLALLIRICTERGFCGLTEKESLRRELVQRLAVGDATHSSLIKALPRRLQGSKYLHEVLRAVAAYRNPSGMQQGKYVLREDCWSELDLYHPRWSPRELQFAEERYIRARKCSPFFLQLPRWRAPYAPLEQIGRFVVTDKVHDILHSVFYHAAFSSHPGDSRATEGLLFTALHLLSLGLDVCSQASYKYVCDSSHIVTSSQEGFDCSLPHSGSPNSSMFAVFSPQRGSPQEASEVPPLLTRSVQRLFVGGNGSGSAAGTNERQSLLSLLVILLRKYGSGEGVMGTVVEANQYSAGDLVRSLLLKFAELNRGCMYEIESMVPEILHRASAALNISPVSSAAVDKVAEDKQGVSDAEKRKAMARERQKAILEKMKAAQEKFLSSLQDENDDSEKAESAPKESKQTEEVGEGTSEDANSVLCALCRDSGSSSPLCFLTLLQKSRLLGIAQKPTPSWERPSGKTGLPLADRGSDSSRSGSEVGSVEYTTADLWNWIQDALGDAATRERLLEGEALLEVFRNGLHPGIRNTLRVANAVGTPPLRAVVQERVDTSDVEEPEGSAENSEIEVCPDAVPLDTPNWWEQESEARVSDDWTSNRELNHVTVLAEYVAAVSRDRRRQGETDVPRNVELEVARELGGLRGRRVPGRNITDANLAATFAMSDTSGVYLSACGHAVHQDCFDRYFGSLLQRYYSRALFEGVQIVDPDVGEFLCPVCRRLANCVVPVFPASAFPASQNSNFSTRERMEVCGGWQEGSSSTSLQLHQAIRLLLNAESLVSKPGFRKAVSTHLPDSIKGALDTLSVRLYGLYHPSTDHASGPGALGRVPQSLHVWDVFRYTLMSTELAARTRQTSIQGTLSSLVILEEGGEGSKGSILPLLLQIAKASQGHSRQVILLRSRGLQLLVDSIVHGVTRDLFLEQSPAGNYTSLKQYLEKSQDGDVQFWKRLSDPILTHDPFSSLIWLLFCLPVPLPPVEGPFLALVHLFYMVCLTQVIAYHGIALSSEAEVGSSVPRFAAAVHSALSGAALSPLDEDSSVTHLCPSLDVIRQLTLPYLRQCFLLRKLLSGTAQVLPVASVHSWELSHRSPANIPLSSKDSNSNRRNEKEDMATDLEEVAQLEALFSVPPLTSLLTDENLLSVVLTWCHHARASTGKELHIKAYIPRPVKATPFKLMELPHLFQDLLQRYVKERCLRCGNVPDRPALCLLCGTLVCAITSRPCACSSLNKQGECYRHAMACGAGVGVFLMLRRTTILLQRCERHAHWPSPYLDAFGEEDLEQRGKPLYLSEERYAALAAMVASHGLDYSSLVLAQTTRQLLW